MSLRSRDMSQAYAITIRFLGYIISAQRVQIKD